MDAIATDVAVMTLAASADFYTTHRALQTCPSCYERNPVMSEPALGIAFKAVTVAGTAVACGRLRRDGHGRAAKVLRWTVTAVWLGLATHNLRVGRP